MYWLPELNSQFDGILQKEAFPFIETINEMESKIYSRFTKDDGDPCSLDYVNQIRAERFRKFPGMKITAI
uniref:Uncharacterized protein n=1 Tax=Panagrolaimus superbus TaxID=310955 RepID=A0A914YKB6_9BILA